MATMSATNQQYYASYPVVAQNVASMSNASAGVQVYHQQQSPYNQHLQHQLPQQQQQQQPQQQQQQQQQHQVQPYQHHQHLSSQSLTPIGQTHQRAVSATSTNSSAAAALYNSIEATKSTKGASKLRRDLINTEIAQLRELLPLPASTRQRLSQLQLMALVLVYVRKSNYFCNAFRNYGIAREPSLAIPDSGFSKALNGFLMMLTQKGKLLYISDNAADYLGHSMEDLLSHGDEVYDIIEDQDKKTIRTELLSNDDDSQGTQTTKSLQQTPNLPSTETRIALCRMNVSRNARRQMRFGDQKVVLIEGHYFGFLPLSSRDEPVFMATCTPVAMPETRECVVQHSTNVFTSIHSMDMKFLYIDRIGEHYLGYTKEQIHGKSWYEMVHLDHLHEAQTKHKRITANDQERSTIVLLKLMHADQARSIWIHSVMQVKEPTESTTQPMIFCTNQVLSDREAQVMRSNSWLYQFYSLHAKAHCNFSANSPVHANQAETPNSVCSDSNDRAELKLSTGAVIATINTSSAPPEQVKSPPVSMASSGNLPSQGASSPSRADTFTSQDNYNTSSAYNNGYQQNQALQKNSISSNKLSPTVTHSPSSSSTISSSPISSSSYQPQSSTGQRYHQLTSSVANPLLGAGTHTEIGIHHHHTNSIGSSSASSTSSSSSSSSQNEVSTTPTANLAVHNVAQSMAVAAAAGTSAAASLYAGIDAIDPLQHMHHSHHHSMYATASNQHHSSHHHAAAAVNYANQVMAAQRVAHQQSHHHHPYHPYHHHQHHPAIHSHQTSHVAPHHHNHHTTPHALYAPSHHHVAAGATAASTALNNPFNHHHHAAAYHSAAAVAAVSAHPTHHHHHHQTGAIQNPYHPASAAAAAAAAHQGVSFHYNKIAAAVNASA